MSKNPSKVSFSTIQAKQAPFKVWRSIQPFFPFWNLFISLKLFHVINWLMKYNSYKDLQRFSKGKKGYAKCQKFFSKNSSALILRQIFAGLRKTYSSLALMIRILRLFHWNIRLWLVHWSFIASTSLFCWLLLLFSLFFLYHQAFTQSGFFTQRKPLKKVKIW